jgi:hypothetical protein
METKREIGGNKLYLKLGKKLTKMGEKYSRKGNKTVILNPTCKFVGPFALKIDFTVDNTDKYQLIIQGDYRDKYKEAGQEENPITVDEMFMLIIQKQNKWYLKNKRDE